MYVTPESPPEVLEFFFLDAAFFSAAAAAFLAASLASASRLSLASSSALDSALTNSVWSFTYSSDTNPSPSSIDTFTHPGISVSTSSSSSMGTIPMTSESLVGSLLTYNVVVFTLASLVPTFFASSLASSPVTQYSAFTYPVQLPDSILYQSPASSIRSPTELLYSLPITSLSSEASALTFTQSFTCAMTRLVKSSSSSEPPFLVVTFASSESSISLSSSSSAALSDTSSSSTGCIAATSTAEPVDPPPTVSISGSDVFVFVSVESDDDAVYVETLVSPIDEDDDFEPCEEAAASPVDVFADMLMLSPACDRTESMTASDVNSFAPAFAATACPPALLFFIFSALRAVTDTPSPSTLALPATGRMPERVSDAIALVEPEMSNAAISVALTILIRCFFINTIWSFVTQLLRYRMHYSIINLPCQLGAP